jgi:hypothetical protein
MRDTVALLAGVPQLGLTHFKLSVRRDEHVGSDEAAALEEALLALLASPALQLLHLPGWTLVAERVGLYRRVSLMGFTARLLAAIAQHGTLSKLRLAGELPVEQWPLLAACTSLRALHLAEEQVPGILAHLPPQLTALTLTTDVSPFTGFSCSQPAAQPPQPAASVPPLRRICSDTPAVVLQVLRPAQLTAVTSLLRHRYLYFLQPLGPSAQASLAQLAALEELHCVPWRGMVPQLSALPQLRSLSLQLRHASPESAAVGEQKSAAVVEGEVKDLGTHMTQLRRLVLCGVLCGDGEEMRQLALKLVRALPSCLVRTIQRV